MNAVTRSSNPANAIAATVDTSPVDAACERQLTEQSFATLERYLASKGNKLSDQHRAALHALVGLFTASARGRLRGRWAFGLPTGMGKTSAIVAWCATLAELQLTGVSVAIAASKVEALCELKRAMIEQGVPANRIGLLYADGGTYSEPRTADNDDRQIMLVSHARVRSGVGLKRFNLYRERARSLLIYDESLIVSDARALSVRDLRGARGYLTAAYGKDETLSNLLGYLGSALAAIENALELACRVTGEATLVDLPEIGEDDVVRFGQLLPAHPVVAPFRHLLDLARETLRVIPSDDGGAVWYQIAVPAELENIVVLDASYPIRELAHADKTIRDAEQHLPEVQGLGVPLSQLKGYGAVTLRQLFVPGGRETMRKDFGRDRWDRRTTSEVVEVVTSVPADEAVLIFVFKKRPGERVDYRAVTLGDLENAGIDTSAQILVMQDGVAKLQPRINVVTWGMETSLNSYAHCRHVILAGVLHRSALDLAGSFVGQSDDLRSNVSPDRLRSIMLSEVCHVIYQALSRGSCRVIDDGKARPMTGWIMHRDDAIQPKLSEVMPGCVWEEWTPTHPDSQPGVVATTTARLVAYLNGLPPTVDRIAVRKLKLEAGLGHVASRSFTRAVQGVRDHAAWTSEGRSLVRLFGEEGASGQLPIKDC